MSYTHSRLEEKVYKTISMLLVSKKLYSVPENAFVTIRRVELSSDTKNATVYYSFLGDDKMRAKVHNALSSSSSIIQKSLASALQTKNTPKLLFKEDSLFEELVHSRQITEDILKKNEE